MGPEDVLHYAYAVFHSPTHRERYAAFLRIGFPRLPLTGDTGLFRRLCERGAELCDLHLMRRDAEGIPGFPKPGSDRVESIAYVPPEADLSTAARAEFAERKVPCGRTGRVYINAKQYFEGVAPDVWSHRIGGYQVAEKWLKDRKDRTLTHDELDHYARTLAALADTRRLMAGIDAIISDHGGWPLR